MKIELKSNKIADVNVLLFNKPKIVYIPLISGNDTDITILVNKGEYVYKGSIVGKSKGNFRIPIHSSVSGIVLGFEEKTCFNGDKIKCVVIENDYKEKIEQKIRINKEINKYTKDEFINIIKENGIIGLGGAGFPTYVKYESNQIKTLIINAAECEPYITADYALASLKCEEILETIDAILDINGIEQAIIAIKKENINLKQLFDNFIGTYLRIKIELVPNFYPIGWERLLIKNTISKNYDKLPIEVGAIVNNISTIYAIYEALKYNKPLIERIITFTGDGFEKSQNVLVKVGTPLKDIFDVLGKKRDTLIVSGGPMMGNLVDEDLVISSNMNCVLTLNNSQEITTSCINCGKCVSVCPAKLSPVLIMKNARDRLQKSHELFNLKTNNCIECGLCSYICPAKLPVREEVIRAKEILNEGRR